MSMDVLAIAGDFFLFIEVLEKFQVVYGTFWIELFFAYHRAFGIFLLRSHPRHLVGKGQQKRHHHRHHKRQPGEQQFPIQVFTG